MSHDSGNMRSHVHVQLNLQLLEACVSNCGKSFQIELTKSAFQSEFKSIITGVGDHYELTCDCVD